MAIKVDPSTNIPTKSSSASEWMQWFESLDDNFGKKQAKALFIKGWKYRGSSGANTLELRNFLNKKGIKIEESLFDNIVDIGGGIADTFTGLFNFGKYTTYAITGIVVVGAAMIIFNLARKPAESAGTVLKFMK